MAVQELERPAWQRGVGVVIPIAAVGLLCALKPEIVRGTFSSGESMLRVGALLAAWVLFSWLTRKVIPNPLVRTVVISVPALALLWWNVAPYFQDDVEVVGGFPQSVTVPTTVAVEGPATATPSSAPAPAASQPVQLTTGRFRGLDGHRGSGEASIFRLPDGTHTVAFRNLSVSSVPDPVVYLVPGPDREDVGGAIRLGRFDADKDRYEIPAGADVRAPVTVMIWCQRFAVPVAGATQQPA